MHWSKPSSASNKQKNSNPFDSNESWPGPFQFFAILFSYRCKHVFHVFSAPLDDLTLRTLRALSDKRTIHVFHSKWNMSALMAVYFGSIKYVGTNWILHLNRRTCYLCYRRWVRFHQFPGNICGPNAMFPIRYSLHLAFFVCNKKININLWIIFLRNSLLEMVSHLSGPRFMWTNTPYLPAYSLFDQTNPSAARSLSLSLRNGEIHPPILFRPRMSRSLSAQCILILLYSQFCLVAIKYFMCSCWVHHSPENSPHCTLSARLIFTSYMKYARSL